MSSCPRPRTSRSFGGRSTAASTRCREGTRRGRKPAGVAYRHEEASEEGQGPQASAPSHAGARAVHRGERSEEHTSELQSRLHLVCRLLLEKKKKTTAHTSTDSLEG